MFRFTIRDLLWLTVVIALAICVCQERISYWRLDATNERLKAEKESLDITADRQLQVIVHQRQELDALRGVPKKRAIAR
jgi:hypothetical protein